VASPLENLSGPGKPLRQEPPTITRPLTVRPEGTRGRTQNPYTRHRWRKVFIRDTAIADLAADTG
jgi:hypothetical protein